MAADTVGLWTEPTGNLLFAAILNHVGARAALSNN